MTPQQLMTPQELRDFEADIASAFNRKEIPFPIHLSGDNEQALIDIFKEVGPSDWVCGSWRFHYHCLLRGVPPSEVKGAIMAGHSMTLCFPAHRCIASAIVGGILPIATGIAMAIKRRGGAERVWCFLGDMTARGGMFRECARYASGHDLPITFVEEDNGLSVCANTEEVWGTTFLAEQCHFKTYVYKLPWPHSGAGQRISF